MVQLITMSDKDFSKQIRETMNELSELYLSDIRTRQLSGSAIKQSSNKKVSHPLYSADFLIDRSQSVVQIELKEDAIKQAAKDFSRRPTDWTFLVQVSETPVRAKVLVQDDKAWENATIATQNVEPHTLPFDPPSEGIFHMLTGILFEDSKGTRGIDGEHEFAMHVPARVEFEEIQKLKKQLSILLSDAHVVKNKFQPGSFVEDYTKLVQKQAEMIESVNNSSLSEHDKTNDLEQINRSFREKRGRLADKYIK